MSGIFLIKMRKVMDFCEFSSNFTTQRSLTMWITLKNKEPSKFHKYSTLLHFYYRNFSKLLKLCNRWMASHTNNLTFSVCVCELIKNHNFLFETHICWMFFWIFSYELFSVNNTIIRLMKSVVLSNQKFEKLCEKNNYVLKWYVIRMKRFFRNKLNY